MSMKVPFILENIKSKDAETFGKEVFESIKDNWPGIKLWHSELRDETSKESRERFKDRNPATTWHKDGIPSYLIALKVISGPGTIYEDLILGKALILKPGQTLILGAMGYELTNGHGFEATRHRHPGPELPRQVLRAEFIPWNKKHKYHKLQEDLNHPKYCGEFFSIDFMAHSKR